jgi:hypothetical protein
MKIFLVYSKKPLRFVSTNEDISALKFIQYGFNWKYALGVINSKFFTFTLAILLIYFALSPFIPMQSIFLTLGIIGTSLHFLYLSIVSKHKLVGTIEAKNFKEARQQFIKEYILSANKIIIKK